MRICITPTRNERWIISKFVELNSHWADLFIVLDQCSTDGTREFLETHPKVDLIKNDSPIYDEDLRFSILWKRVRELTGVSNTVFALDADEFIPPALSQSSEWDTINSLPQGTGIQLDWVEVLPGATHYLNPMPNKIFGYIDDGATYSGKTIHTNRTPIPPEVYIAKEIVNVHLGNVCLNRNYRKHTHYMMWEIVNKQNGAYTTNLHYRRLADISNAYKTELSPKWLPKELNIDALDLTDSDPSWWDSQIAEWFDTHGTKHFRKLDIWQRDWTRICGSANGKGYPNPQRGIDKVMVSLSRKLKNPETRVARLLNSLLMRLWR